MNLDYRRLEILTRFIIFLPLIVVLIFIFRESKTNTAQTNSFNPTIPVETSQVTTPKNIKIDLNGPYACSYTQDGTQVQLSIQNKNVAATYIEGNKTTHMIVANDCGYIWHEGELTGQKLCNIGPYLSMVEMLSSFDMLDVDSILSMAQQVDPSIDVSKEVSENIMNTCVKEEIEASAFSVPSTITFTEIQSLSPSTAP